MTNMVYTTIHVHAPTREFIGRWAAERNRSMGYVMREILEQWVEQQKAKASRKGGT